MTDYYVGLISGTSTDGIDAVLATIAEDRKVQIDNACSVAYPAPVRRAVEELARTSRTQPIDLQRAGELNVQLGELFAAAAQSAISGTNPDRISGSSTNHARTIPPGSARSTVATAAMRVVTAPPSASTTTTLASVTSVPMPAGSDATSVFGSAPMRGKLGRWPIQLNTAGVAIATSMSRQRERSYVSTAEAKSKTSPAIG